MSRWMVAAKRADFKELAEKYHIDMVTARLIRNRDVVGYEAIERYLSGDIGSMHDPHLMRDMDRAVDTVTEAVEDGSRIRIVGDYDVDGICSTYILYKGLKAIGAENVDYYLPDRIRDGYGMNAAIVKKAAEDGVGFILTCDNGIRAIEEIKLARELGIKVVVTDHHEPKRGDEGDVLPEACAVVDPAREDDEYPYPAICGAVVAYKFIQVMLDKKGASGVKELLDELIVFAAFATNCDVMPLVDENRLIMREGLKRAADCKNPGLTELIKACGLDVCALSASDFGFTLGPCLNATGRLDTAHRAMELLTAQDRGVCAGIAGDLMALNGERKTLTVKGVGDAREIYESGELAGDMVLVIYLPDCHESVAGIIAGRVRERYSRPAIILTDAAEEGLVKGSGRSVPGYDMYGELSRFESLFIRFGGHEQAAGLTMRREDIGALRRGLNDACELKEEDMERKLHIDMEMPMSYATAELVKEFSLLEPFGKGNPEPLFAARDVRILKGRIVGKNKNVGKYEVGDRNGRIYDMVCFEGLDRFNEFLGERFGAEGLRDIYDSYRARGEYACNMAYRPKINSYMGRETLQFVLKDYQ